MGFCQFMWCFINIKGYTPEYFSSFWAAPFCPPAIFSTRWLGAVYLVDNMKFYLNRARYWLKYDNKPCSIHTRHIFWRSRFADTNLGTVYGNLKCFPVWCDWQSSGINCRTRFNCPLWHYCKCLIHWGVKRVSFSTIRLVTRRFSLKNSNLGLKFIEFKLLFFHIILVGAV